MLEPSNGESPCDLNSLPGHQVKCQLSKYLSNSEILNNYITLTTVYSVYLLIIIKYSNFVLNYIYIYIYIYETDQSLIYGVLGRGHGA